jgi:hypothetical protein
MQIPKLSVAERFRRYVEARRKLESGTSPAPIEAVQPVPRVAPAHEPVDLEVRLRNEQSDAPTQPPASTPEGLPSATGVTITNAAPVPFEFATAAYEREKQR